jgi:spermidine synthase
LKLHFLQHLFSYLLPLKVASAEGITTPLLSLYRYQGRWQLSAATAIYSDGAAYRPLKEAFGYLKKELPGKQNMLVLGAGLGSAVYVLDKMNIKISATLVDIDPQIIKWGKEIINSETQVPCEWFCNDVQNFVGQHQILYDLIVLDVFQDRLVPQFVTTIKFLKECSRLLQNDKSYLVFNYIINNQEKWETALQNIQSVFTIEHTISIGINRIMILKNIV